MGRGFRRGLVRHYEHLSPEHRRKRDPWPPGCYDIDMVMDGFLSAARPAPFALALARSLKPSDLSSCHVPAFSLMPSFLVGRTTAPSPARNAQNLSSLASPKKTKPKTLYLALGGLNFAYNPVPADFDKDTLPPS